MDPPAAEPAAAAWGVQELAEQLLRVEQQHGLRWAVRMARSWSARLGVDVSTAAMLAAMASADTVARWAASTVATYLALDAVLYGQPDAWVAPLTDMLRAGEAAAAGAEAAADVLLRLAVSGPAARFALAAGPAARAVLAADAELMATLRALSEAPSAAFRIHGTPMSPLEEKADRLLR
jgi:hypothetical protein